MPRKNLSRRLFLELFFFAVGAALVIAALITAVSYQTYEKDMTDSLLSRAEAVASALNQVDADYRVRDLSTLAVNDVRCTLVGGDGTVLYDSEADPSTMENHNGRPEIEGARANGESTSSRTSSTVGEDLMFAAVALDDGQVVRLGEEKRSFPAFVGSMLPAMAVGTIAELVVAYLIARLLVRRIVKPFDAIDLQHPSVGSYYEEMQPLVDRIDEQRRQLVKSNEELRRAANLRREFTGNVSHEMKTPLQVIGGYAELMENGMVPPSDVKHFAGLILTESRAMRSLVDDVLTLSHLDEGNMVGDDAPLVDLSQVVIRVSVRLRPKFEEKHLSTQLLEESAHSEEALVRGNEALLEQLVYNLLDNAARYSVDGGRVRVRIARTGDTVSLAVDDDGPGVEEEYRERIFERFFRVDESRSRETGGTGLGLAIVKHAAEAHGGTVHVEESEWGGASFVVELPAAVG